MHWIQNSRSKRGRVEKNSMKDNRFLSVHNLTIEYVTKEETVHAVNNVSFELEKGKTLGLVGETGAGKTTIARSILRILQVPYSL